MTPLPTSISEAIKASAAGQLQFVDPETQQIYFLVDSETHRRAMEAMRQQGDWDAIQEGVEQAKRGESISSDELKAQIRARYTFSVGE